MLFLFALAGWATSFASFLLGLWLDMFEIYNKGSFFFLLFGNLLLLNRTILGWLLNNELSGFSGFFTVVLF